MINRESEREALIVQSHRAELVERIARAVPEDGRIDPFEGLFLRRSSSTMESLHAIAKPAFCLIAQGSKEIFVGEHRYQYDPYHYLLATVEMPVVGHVIEASKERPYLAMGLLLDSTLVSSVMLEARCPSLQSRNDVRAFDVSPLSVTLLDAVVRLVRLLDSPADIPILAPLITREIIYRLLMSEQGNRLRHIANLGGHSHRITRAVERLQKDFNQPLSIESIARETGMSVSSFHHHFKAVTEMTPLQFQKRVRLQEARRLMLSENLDASSAGYRVGYDDVSHFSREYKRLFGDPPMRDVQRLRETARV